MRCPICQGEKLKSKRIETQEFSDKKNIRLFECWLCGAAFPEDFNKNRAQLYSSDYAAWRKTDPASEQAVAQAKKMAFREQLKILLKYIQPKDKKLLDVGASNGYLLEEVNFLGFDAWGTEISDYSLEILIRKFPGRIRKGEPDSLKFETNFFDTVTLTDVLEHLASPLEIMAEIRRILKNNGILFIISPNYSSLTRYFFGRKWFQYKYEHVLYYDRKSLEHLLEKNGFKLLEFRNNRKKFTLSYYYYYFGKYDFLGLGKIFKLIYRCLPANFRNWSFSNPITGEFIAVARKIK